MAEERSPEPGHRALAGTAAERDSYTSVVLTRRRSSADVWGFVARYVAPGPLARSDAEFVTVAGGGSIPRLLTLEKAMRLGLGGNAHPFALVGLPAQDATLLSASLGFSADGGLVLALEAAEIEVAGERLLQLASEFGAEAGCITDGALPLSAAELDEMVHRDRLMYLATE